jgi:hypothetical protein
VYKCNAKMILVETIPEIGGGEIMESSREGEFKHDIVEILYVRTFVNTTMYPHPV